MHVNQSEVDEESSLLVAELFASPCGDKQKYLSM
jgi:hypothetical protein